MIRNTRYLKGKNHLNENVAQILCKKIYRFTNELRPSYLRDESLYNFELTPWRPGSQVSVQANAYNPCTKSQNEFTVSLYGPHVGLTCQVMPPRTAVVSKSGITIEQNTSSKMTPIHLGHAFGGSQSGKTHPLNPIGSGYFLQRNYRDECIHSLPLLEDPQHLLQENDFFEEDLKKLPLPMHFGNTPCSLSPEPWWNVHPKLRSPTLFTNSSEFILTHMHPRIPTLLVKMPDHSPQAWINAPTGKQSGTMFIRDVNIQVHEQILSIIWGWNAPLLDDHIPYRDKNTFGLLNDV